MTDCSIVIPVHDGADLTRRCLDTLAGQDLGGAEIVVVDDASTDATAELVDVRDDIRVVRNERNLGFGASCNAGVAHARGRHVVLLNNDTQPCEGWLDALTRYADAHPEAGIVGAKLVWPSGAVQHAGVAISQTRDVRHIYAGLDAGHPAVNRSRAYQAVTAACMLIRREVFEEAGGFDAAFVNGYEDVDLCLRVRELGHEVHYCHDAVVYHLESSTRGHDPHGTGPNWELYHRRWDDRVRPDDVEHYLRDGLLEVSYDHNAVKVSVDPVLGGSAEDGPPEMAALLSLRASQVLELQRENARLARASSWSPSSRPEEGEPPRRETAVQASIVVSMDHEEPVEPLIAALTRQTVSPESFEVFVMHPEARLPYRADPGPLTLIHLATGPVGGRAAAYNRGIRQARSDLIVLLGDDAIPEPGFLAAHLALHAEEPDEHVVGIGPVVFPERLRDLAFRRWIEDSGQLFGVPLVGAEPPPPFFFFCANASAKRSFLLGGELFDERLSLSAWDDYDLGRRLLERGMTTRFVPEARTSHEHELTLAERRDVMHDSGVSAARFDAIYPPGHPWNTATDHRVPPPLVDAQGQWARLRHRLTGREADLHTYFARTLRAAFLRGYRAEAGRLESGGSL